MQTYVPDKSVQRVPVGHDAPPGQVIRQYWLLEQTNVRESNVDSGLMHTDPALQRWTQKRAVPGLTVVHTAVLPHCVVVVHVW